MAPSQAKTILSSVLLALQFCLGFWQICKFTPVGALIQSFVASWLLLPFGLSRAYAQLKGFEGRIYKTVRCHVTCTGEWRQAEESAAGKGRTQIKSSYLKVDFVLERRGENMLFLNGVMSYYITEKIWHSLLEMERVAPTTAFLKGYKEFWQQVATGGVMTLTEVLDSLILENQIIRGLDNDLLLPVNLSVSEEKLLKFLNLLGLFLQTKQVHWLYPTMLSLTSAILEFSTTLRVVLYNNINLLFCVAMHLVCDKLSRPTRRQIYSFGCWVENLKPCNDIALKVVRGSICVIIGGGAKTHKEGAVACADDMSPLVQEENGKTSCCFGSNPIVEAWFNPKEGKCHLRARTVALADVECSEAEFLRIKTFLSQVAKHRSGSLKTCDRNNKVHVRGFRKSVMCYSNSGFPPVYELHIEDAVVNGVEC